MSEPTDRQIQHLLQYDAAQVIVPTDMWDKIAGRLEADARLQTNREDRRPRWRNMLLLGVCAAAFGVMALQVSSDQLGEGSPTSMTTSRRAVAAAGWAPGYLQRAGSPAAGNASGNGTQVISVSH